MLKKLLRVAVIGTSVLALVACAAGQGAGPGNGNMSQNRYGMNAIDGNRMNTTNGYGVHNNKNIRVNREAEQAVERVAGVARANVVVGDSNAYVAVQVDRNQTDTRGPDYTGMQGLNTRRGTAGTGMGGVNAYDGRSGRVGINRTGMLGANNAADNNGNGNYMYNGGAFGRTNTRGTTASNGLDPQLLTRIQSAVRQVVPGVRNIYVSADQNFIDRMGTYGDRFNGDGRPVQNLISDFNAFVGDIFGVDGYDVNNRYNVRNRNGTTQQMNNSTLR